MSLECLRASSNGRQQLKFLRALKKSVEVAEIDPTLKNPEMGIWVMKDDLISVSVPCSRFFLVED